MVPQDKKQFNDWQDVVQKFPTRDWLNVMIIRKIKMITELFAFLFRLIFLHSNWFYFKWTLLQTGSNVGVSFFYALLHYKKG